MMPLLQDPTAPRKKYALVKFIREYNGKHPPEMRITYYREEGKETSAFDPSTTVIGVPARETLKKVQRVLRLPVSGHFDQKTMAKLLPVGLRGGVMARAHGELGVHEWPSGSNSGPVRKYLESAGYPWAGPWCAAFVCWVLKKEGFPRTPVGSASVEAWLNLAHQQDLIIPVQKSKLGDLWVWGFSGNVHAHIGFCDDTDPADSIAYGLDGNVGSYGGSVTQVQRASGLITACIDLEKLHALK
jgi:hypothetical protein